MVISKSIPLTDLLQKIGSKFKLYGSLKLVYKEKTLTTDDHLARVLHNTNLITTALHFSVTTEEDIFDFY